jgi:hypothetical protein
MRNEKPGTRPEGVGTERPVRRRFSEVGSEASAKKLGTRLSQMPLAVRD